MNQRTEEAWVFAGIALLVASVVALIGAGACGYVSNIVKLVEMDATTGMLVVRAIGILVAPLGAVLGYF